MQNKEKVQRFLHRGKPPTQCESLNDKNLEWNFVHIIKILQQTTYSFGPFCGCSYYPFDNWCDFKRFEAHFCMRFIRSCIQMAVKLRHFVFSWFSMAGSSGTSSSRFLNWCVGVLWVHCVGNNFVRDLFSLSLPHKKTFSF